MRIEPLGDRALVVHLGDAIDAATLARVREAVARIDAAAHPAVTDVVPGFASVTVHYDPRRVAPALPTLRSSRVDTPFDLMAVDVAAAIDAPAPRAREEARLVEIPVCYGGELGPDLAEVARARGLDEARVVELHAAGDYLVHMIGFLPGFPYLGGLAPELATPRRETPRTAVPAGSVGIGGAQTGVYPIDSPGGWQLIGRTPLRLFDPRRAPAVLLRVGDRVRFRAVAREEYESLVPGQG